MIVELYLKAVIVLPLEARVMGLGGVGGELLPQPVVEDESSNLAKALKLSWMSDAEIG